MKYQRRTDDDRIAELNAKIEGIRARSARKAARANPAVREATAATKAIQRALDAQPDDRVRPVLEQALAAIRGALDGPVPDAEPIQPAAAPKRRVRAKAATTA